MVSPDWAAPHPPDLPPVRRREVFAWALFDFANSGYTTVVITAVFAAYFVGAVAGGAEWATFAWTLALSISHLIVMFLIKPMKMRHPWSRLNLCQSQKFL